MPRGQLATYVNHVFRTVAQANHLGRGQRLESTEFIELNRRYVGNRTNTIASHSASNCPKVDFIAGDETSGKPPPWA